MQSSTSTTHPPATSESTTNTAAAADGTTAATTTTTTTTTTHNTVAESTTTTTTTTESQQQQEQEQPRSLNLFDYTEEELYCSHSNNSHQNNNNGDSDHSNHNNTSSSNNNKKNNSNSNNSSSKLKFNYYEILQIPIHATSYDIKKAYRKLSLLYHPDKTGRDENDYVFLAIKNAYDTLMDPIKRNGYDSTVLTFDDTIPPSRATLLLQQQQSIPGATTTMNQNTYTDDDFYTVYGPVFVRNLRFDARLRPELKHSSSSGSLSNNNNSHHHNKQQSLSRQNTNTTTTQPPTLGDANTPLHEVHAFYDYWISFTSWRDFSLKATQELQLSDMNAESRYEKRYYQKEIDKRTKYWKRQEMIRIQTLVERAMEADPRLRKERQEQLLAKERVQEEKRLEKLRIEEERIRQEKELQMQEEQFKIQKQQEKIQREQYKKLLRKSKQSLRKVIGNAYSIECEILLEQQKQQQQSTIENDATIDNNNNNNQPPVVVEAALTDPLLWKDSYDLNQDIDYLCSRLTLDEINILIENCNDFCKSENDNPDTSTTPHCTSTNDDDNNITDDDTAEVSGSHALLLEFVHQHVQEQRVKEQQESDAAKNNNNNVKTVTTITTTNTTNVWSTMELSTLVKALKKYPTGGAGRWDAICNMINHTCTLVIPRTRQECIDKYNKMLKQQQQQQQLKKNNHSVTNGSNNNNNNATGQDENIKNSATTTTTTNGTKSASSPNDSETNILNGSNDTTTTTTTGTNDTTTTTDTVWNAEQDRLLQEALLLYPTTIEKNERWTLIASHIPNKSKKACVQRFKTIRQEIITSQQQQQAPST